jgi:extradiol dioxygenase family protein
MFLLSIGVNSVESSVNFFATVVEAEVLHRDSSGYVNIDLFNRQITLKPNSIITPDLPDFHFGINLGIEEFDKLASHIMKCGRETLVMAPTVG